MTDEVSREVIPVEQRHTLRDILYALPKVDLHRHLEGSLRLSTMAEIAREHGVDLPSYDIEELRPYVQITDDEPDYRRFLEKFRLLRRFYSTREAVERIAYEAVADAAADNVRYLELRFNPIALAEAGCFAYHQVVEWAIDAVRRAEQDCDIQVRLIVQLSRDSSPRTAWEVAEVAMAFRDRGIVALDLAGDEVNYPGYPFAPIFQRAREAGMHITIHAGEWRGPESVREAVQVLGAQRLGHGIRVIEDPQLVQLVRERDIALEVCPTSNLQTGAVDSLGLHPLKELYHQGVRVTVNTDDPSVSNTTLTDEYMVVIRGIGMTLEELKHMILMAVQAAFLPEPEKEQLYRWFADELHQARRTNVAF